MPNAFIERIHGDPRYQDLVRRRSRLSWSLTATMLVIYFGFMFTLAFWPDQLGAPFAAGWAMSVGIPAGAFVILAAVALTSLYVVHANARFDRLVREVVEAAR